MNASGERFRLWFDRADDDLAVATQHETRGPQPTLRRRSHRSVGVGHGTRNPESK